MSPPINDNAPVARGEVGRATTSVRGFSRDTPLHVKRDNVIPFRARRRTCGACGQHLALDDLGAACARCLAWDMLLRAMSLRRQALGELARAGG